MHTILENPGETGRATTRTVVEDGLRQLLAAQGPHMREHLAKVADLACSTAIILDLPTEEVRLTRLGAEFHDVGKLGIPASILRKSEALSAEEEWFMQRHSEIGECLVAATPALRAIAPIVRAVHERPDGRGYPDGLVGGEIPVASRIIAVVDAFDAMTNDRPYQEATDAEAALAELRLLAGTQFDAGVVEAFAEVVAYCR
jgi:HD-GYP domain-containing protein (c-di-GMP phosphodiesterase class II)